MRYSFAPTYNPFYQLPYCCVPATLQWILYRRGLDILDQETIGIELGLRLPPNGKNFFTNKNIHYVSKEPKGGFGTQIEKNKFSIERFFTKYKIPLNISSIYNFRDKIKLKNFIIKNMLADHDIIMRYNNKITNGENQKSYGHLSVIVEFDDKTDIVIVGDPQIPHYKIVSLDQIICSISDQIDGIQRGLYIVSPK
jgi:hypothetical protein